MAGPLSITNCEADAFDKTLVVTFSEPVDATIPPTATSATNPNNYTITLIISGVGTGTTALSATVASNGTTAVITTPGTFTFNPSEWIQVEVRNVTPRGGGTPIASPNNIFVTQVHANDVGVAAGDIAL